VLRGLVLVNISSLVLLGQTMGGYGNRRTLQALTHQLDLANKG
jgi:hypothetical protein